MQSNAKDDVRMRQDVDHIRRLMSENQNALMTVVTVLSSIQEEVRRLSITVHKNQTLQIQPPSLSSALLRGNRLLPNSSSSAGIHRGVSRQASAAGSAALGLAGGGGAGGGGEHRSRESSVARELKSLTMFANIDASQI